MTKSRIDLIDEIYLALEDLAGENLDGFITDEIYTRRKVQLLAIAVDNDITKQDLDQARIRRYGVGA